MAKILGKSTSRNEDDDEEDLEALRLAALKTLGKKPVQQPTAVFKPQFKPHFGNPNLIAIIPGGAPRELPGRQKPPLNQKQANNRQSFFRHPQARPQALKVLPQVQLENKPADTFQETKSDEKEEVSTKFSRYEDTESESEDESETDKKESDESSDESEDVLAIENEDDSLEALMAQMEHEIEAGIDIDPGKKEKKKKGNKTKEKEVKVKAEVKPNDNIKAETKTAIVEPTIIDRVESDNTKSADKKSSEGHNSLVMSKPSANVVPMKDNCLSNEASSIPLRKISKSPIRQISVAPLQMKSVTRTSPERERQKSITPPRVVFRTSPSPKRDTRRRSVTPPRIASRYPRAPLSPRRDPSPINRMARSRSPVKRKSFSPRRSPISRMHSPPRRKSPRKYSPDRRSPLNRSPKNYYNSNKSPSPYYMSREREYGTARRSRTPIRRKSFSPRNVERSPKYSKRRSLSPWSPSRRSKSPPRYRSRSPVHRRSVSPRSRKYVKSKYASPLRNSPKRRSPLSPVRSPRRRGVSPRRLASPKRDIKYVSPKRDGKYVSPKRDVKYVSPRRDVKYRRSSPSPKRRSPPPYKRASPAYMSKQRQRSISPRRRISPVADKEKRPRSDRRSRTPSLSLSPSPSKDSKEPSRRYTTNSPSRASKVLAENTNNHRNRTRKDHSPDVKSGDKDRKKGGKSSDREVGKQWDRKVDDRRRERSGKRDRDDKRIKSHDKGSNKKSDSPKEDDTSLKVTDNPIFEARRKKFESKAVVEPASKKICLVNKKNTVNEERVEPEEKKDKEEKQVIENSVQTEADIFSAHEEIDEIDSFLNEDVLDLSAEVWSSDDDLFPRIRTKSPAQAVKKVKPPAKHKTEKVSTKDKSASRKARAATSPEAVTTKTTRRKKSKTPSRKSPKVQKPEKEKEKEKERDDSDLRAELSRRREERLTKAGSLHEKLPARLLQSAFESALGKKKAKKEVKSQKIEKKISDKESVSPPPPPKERSDGRRVLVLKRQAPVRMQSAHINVTFPKDAGSDSDCSYSSSASSSDERYAAKRKLPVYLRLGAAPQRKSSGGRNVKLRSRRSQV